MNQDVTGQEPDAFRQRGTLMALAGAAALLVLALVAVWTLFPQVRQSEWKPPEAFEAPTLQTVPVIDHRAWLLQQSLLLAGEEGRRPIGEAMAAIAARGPAAFDPVTTP